MVNIIVKLLVPFTFCDEGTYTVRIWHDAIINVKHVQNKEAVEKIKGIKIMGTPQMIPDDPHGLYYVSDIELNIPLDKDQSPIDLATNVNHLEFLCGRYLGRLIEVIRFATHRYWLRMINQFDLDIVKIETEDEKGRHPLMPFRFGFPQGFTFALLPIYEQSSKQNLINKLLAEGLKLQLSNNLILDCLSNFHSGKFEESIIIANISLEVFVEEFLTEKFKSQGKDETTVKELVDQLFDGRFHKTMRKAFFKNMTEDERKHHEIWVKFDNLRAKRKQVIHPHTRKLSPQETYDALIDLVTIREWIINISFRL